MSVEEPVLVLRVGQQMIDIMTRFDGLMEFVYWDKETGRWEEDFDSGIAYQLATGLNRLKASPAKEDIR